MSAPTFSVVMPAYDAEATVGAAVTSVLAQDDADFELIVIDDGSRDGTAAVVRGFADPRVRLVEQPNRGAAAARNAGVAAASGRLVAFVDSDDLWLPAFLSSMRGRFDETPDLALCYTDAWVLDQRSHRVAVATAMQWERPPAEPPSDPSAFLAELIERNFVFNSTVVRRDVFADLGGFDETLPAAIDYEMWLRVAAAGYRCGVLPGLYAVYRRHRAGSISSDRAQTFRSLCRVFERLAADERLPPRARELAQRRLDGARRELAALEGRRTLDGAWRAAVRPLLLRVRNRVLRKERWYDEPPPPLRPVAPLLRR